MTCVRIRQNSDASRIIARFLANSTEAGRLNYPGAKSTVLLIARFGTVQRAALRGIGGEIPIPFVFDC